MNKKDRQQLEAASNKLLEARELIEAVRDEEQNKFDNLPEGFQQAETGQKFEDDINSLDEIIEQIDNAVNDLNQLL